MKNKKTRVRLPSVIVVGLTFILFFSNFTTVFATDAMDNATGDVTIVADVITPSDGAITPKGDLGYYTTKTLVATTYKKMVLAKYLTSSWAKVSSYSYTDTGTLSFTFGYAFEGMNLSVGFSKSISTTLTIPADASRYSKLAAFANFTIKKYLTKRYTTGGVLVDTYYTYNTTTTATFIDKKYQ